MHISKKKTLLSLALAGLVSTQVQAASVSGSMDLKVTMPEILVLYHFDEVQIDLTSAGVSTAANDSDPYEVSEGAASTVTGPMGTPITAALAIEGEGTYATASQTLDVVLESAWAVRSISSADVTVSGSVQTGTLTHATESGSSIAVTNMTLTAGSATGTSVDLAPQWALQTGSINFQLNLEDAEHAGLYQSAATAAENTDTFLLTLTGN